MAAVRLLRVLTGFHHLHRRGFDRRQCLTLATHANRLGRLRSSFLRGPQLVGVGVHPDETGLFQHRLQGFRRHSGVTRRLRRSSCNGRRLDCCRFNDRVQLPVRPLQRPVALRRYRLAGAGWAAGASTTAAGAAVSTGAGAACASTTGATAGVSTRASTGASTRATGSTSETVSLAAGAACAASTGAAAACATGASTACSTATGATGASATGTTVSVFAACLDGESRRFSYSVQFADHNGFRRDSSDNHFHRLDCRSLR